MHLKCREDSGVREGFGRDGEEITAVLGGGRLGVCHENNGPAYKNSMSVRLQRLAKCLMGGEEQNMFCWGLKRAREARGEGRMETDR